MLCLSRGQREAAHQVPIERLQKYDLISASVVAVFDDYSVAMFQALRTPLLSTLDKL